MSRDSFIQFVRNNEEINDEVQRIATITLQQLQQQLQHMPYEPNELELVRKIQNYDHNISHNNILIKCNVGGWAVYNFQLLCGSPVTPQERLSGSFGAILESFFLYAVNIMIAYMIISSIHTNNTEKKNRDLAKQQLMQLRQVRQVRQAAQENSDMIITNENIISAIEALTSSSVKRPKAILCLISNMVMTEPCYIQTKVDDRWVTLDGYFEKNTLDEWFKISDIVPQTGQRYCADRYRMIKLPSEHTCCSEINDFMNKLIQEYPAMQKKQNLMAM